VATDFGGGTGTPQNVYDRFGDRGNSAFDLRQRFTLSYSYALPGPRKGAMGYLLGGWQLNGIIVAQTGLPFTVSAANSTVNNNTGSRPNCLASATLSSPTIQDWFNLNVFATPAPYTYGNCGRDTLFGPGRWNVDQSLFKNFRFREKLTMELRAEAFNIFNHPHFDQPDADIASQTFGRIINPVASPTSIFGSFLGADASPRLVQLHATFTF